MAVFSGAFSVPGTSASITLQLHVNQVSQSIANNTSTVNWTLQAVKGSAGYPYTYNKTSSASADVNGLVLSVGGLSYNFPSGAYTWVIGSGSTVVGHNADGTKTISCAGAFSDGDNTIGNAWCGGNLTLTTIPRATQPTVSPAAGDTGSSFTIGHAPATSSFYHDISYSINGGTSFTPIETNVVGTDTSTTWTPPHSLLPNDSTKTAIIRCVTRASSGGTVIGTKDVSVNLTVPSSVKPVVSTVAFEEAQLSSPNMVTLMGGPGRYVRRWSKLKPTVTSSGAGGSSVVSSSVTLAGQTTPSGVAFAEPVNVSGSPSFSATAVDTRGRSSDVYYNTVTVKAYDYPSLPVPTITRTSDAAGLNPSPTGTYLRVTPNASTSKLDFGDGEKNLLEWQIRTRPRGGSWTVAQAWTTATVSGNTIWTTPKVLAGYAANTEYEVEVSIRDLFGKNGFDTANTVKTLTMNVPSEAVFMDWNESTGIGLGRYHSGSGARLQVAGGIDVATGDLSVAGVSILTSNTTTKGIVELATNAETQTGTDAVRAVTPASLKSLTATEARAGLAEIATQAEVNAGTDAAKYVSPKTLHDTLGRAGFDVPIALDLDSLYMGYGERHNTMDFEDRVRITVLESGAVVLSGLVHIEGTPAGGKIIGTFPAEYAPEYVTVIPVEMGDTPRSVYIHPDGTIRAGAFYSANTYLSLDGVAFIRKGFGSWMNLGPFGPNFAAYNVSVYGTPAYWKDEYGFVWWRGAVTITTNAGLTDNTTISPIPTSIGFYKSNSSTSSEGHYRAAANDALGVVGVSGSVIKFKSGSPTTVGTVIHLGGLVSMTEDSLVHATRVVWTTNSWLNYGGLFPSLKYGKRPDGIVFTSGLIGGGTIGAAAFAFRDRSMAPQQGTKILATVSNTNRGRIDLGGMGTVDQSRKGKFFPQQGSNPWYSLDGKVWIP